MASRAVSIALKWPWTHQDLFGDLRVRYGIKVGLAGLLALFCSQALRLPSDNWAMLTVIVLMNQQFIGAFAFKAIMRMTGTIAGALKKTGCKRIFTDKLSGALARRSVPNAKLNVLYFPFRVVSPSITRS